MARLYSMNVVHHGPLQELRFNDELGRKKRMEEVQGEMCLHLSRSPQRSCKLGQYLSLARSLAGPRSLAVDLPRSRTVCCLAVDLPRSRTACCLAAPKELEDSQSDTQLYRRRELGDSQSVSQEHSRSL